MGVIIARIDDVPDGFRWTCLAIDGSPGPSGVCPTRAEAEAEAARALEQATWAEVQRATTEVLSDLRAEIAADLRVWAEQGGDPWMVHVADEVAAGRRPETGNNDGAEGREG
jgi:hypothetical protein